MVKAGTGESLGEAIVSNAVSDFVSSHSDLVMSMWYGYTKGDMLPGLPHACHLSHFPRFSYVEFLPLPGFRSLYIIYISLSLGAFRY